MSDINDQRAGPTPPSARGPEGAGMDVPGWDLPAQPYGTSNDQGSTLNAATPPVDGTWTSDTVGYEAPTEITLPELPANHYTAGSDGF